MRIIGGEFRGRELTAAAGLATRPITDRAKQSLFDALADCFAVEGGGIVLDCFAGTGSMGLECLSRGARKAIFVEKDRQALRGLKENIAVLGVAERSVVVEGDAYAVVGNGEVRGLTVAFVDPPYEHTESGRMRHKVDQLLRGLAQECMVDGGIISFRHPTRVAVDVAALQVKVVREFKYGEMGITWLRQQHLP